MFFKVDIMDVSIIKISHEVIYQLWLFVDMIIYKPLEDRGCVHETECHDIKLEGAVQGIECCEPFLTLLDTQLVVTGFHIKFGEYLGSLYLVHDLVDTGEGVCIPNSEVIEVVIIDDQSFRAILLSYEEHWGSCRATGGTSCDHAGVKHAMKPFFQNSVLGLA